MAQEPRPIDEVSTQQLLDLYRERCQRDIESLAQSLDGLDNTIRQRVLSSDDRAIGDAISLAWKQGVEARRLYANLLEVPRRYNLWARRAGLRAEFSVREEDTRGNKPREAIRPLILPLLGETARAAWSDRERDKPEWRSSRSAQLYEFLTLLRWLSRKGDNLDTSWLRQEAGADLVAAWNGQPGRDFTLLQGQYTFKTSRPADQPETPLCLRGVVAALVPERDASGQYPPEVLERRDATLVALLQLLAEEQGGDVAASWFSFACRRGPPFTALQSVQVEATIFAGGPASLTCQGAL